MSPARRATTVYTIGHSNRTIDEFVALLAQVKVTRVVDVRSMPRSRAMPQFNQEMLPGELTSAGIGYVHLAALGGRRHHRRGAPDSPNTYWTVAAFRNYADYAATQPFGHGLDALVALATREVCAIMCAEAVWWRCHRRIIADYLLTDGLDVQHIMGAGKVVPATLTPGVYVVADGTLRYNGPGDSSGGAFGDVGSGD